MKRTLAILLLGAGFLVIAAGAVAWLDPVGTRMADDSDPHGPPGSTVWSAGVVGLDLLGVVAGWRLLRSEHGAGIGSDRAREDLL